MRTIRLELFTPDPGSDRICWYNYFGTVYAQTKQERREMVERLESAGYPVKLKMISHNDFYLTFSYLVSPKQRSLKVKH